MKFELRNSMSCYELEELKGDGRNGIDFVIEDGIIYVIVNEENEENEEN